MTTDAAKLNYYEVMDLDPRTATEAMIRERYQELKAFYASKEVRDQGVFTDNELLGLQEILEEAFAVLGNSTLKVIYDEKMGFNVTVSEAEQSSHSETVVQVSEEAPVAVVLGSNKMERSAKAQKMSWKLDYAKDPERETYFANLIDWSGHTLREVREYKGVSVQQLSQFTKINSFYISAVEDMLPANLPASVFVRGYIVQIARALGLPEEKVVTSYMANFQRSSEKSKNLYL